MFYHYFLYYYMIFMETESVSEVTGSHDKEDVEKKIIISAYYYIVLIYLYLVI